MSEASPDFLKYLIAISLSFSPFTQSRATPDSSVGLAPSPDRSVNWRFNCGTLSMTPNRSAIRPFLPNRLVGSQSSGTSFDSSPPRLAIALLTPSGEKPVESANCIKPGLSMHFEA